ncbi:MAG: beta-ketoacyl-ACP synthase [Sulfurimonadaceae bacterium]|nr:beta-ketoacyl-ACP synthase [Sulfurimonadaceae bacterium]
MRRVVITGVGMLSPLGHDMETLKTSLEAMKSGVHAMPEWSEFEGLESRVCGLVDWNDYKAIPRRDRRSMGRVALMAAKTMQDAIADSGLTQEEVSNPRTGIAFGSTMGADEEIFPYITEIANAKSFNGQTSMGFLKIMSHTVAANIAAMFNIRGRNLPTCSACTSSSMAIGTGYESIKYGMSDIMFVGGSEGAHALNAGVFEIMAATSKGYNDRPEATPRPFDGARDGLVTSEGAGTLVLEEYEHAKARGATIYAEVIGYATSCDGEHITTPSKEGMEQVMRLALEDAKIAPDAVGYINAHATSTQKGDIAESHATYAVFSDATPISSTKGYMGHLLGGCGVVESIIGLISLQSGLMPANKNLETVDPECAPLDYLKEHRYGKHEIVMNNNFAFGGINTSLIFKKL